MTYSAAFVPEFQIPGGELLVTGRVLATLES